MNMLHITLFKIFPSCIFQKIVYTIFCTDLLYDAQMA